MTSVEARPQLVYTSWTIDGITMNAWITKGSKRAPVGVIGVAGRGGIQLGSSQAMTSLDGAVMEAMTKAGIPCMSPDHEGAGVSAPGVSAKSVRVCMRFAHQYVEKVVLCFYVHGSHHPLIELLAGDAYAYISISLGDNGDSQSSTIKCRAVCGWGGASDSGKDTTLEIVGKGSPSLKLMEGTVGQFCSAFVTELHDDLAARAPAAAAPEAKPTPGLAPEVAPAAQSAAQVSFDFGVTCLKPQRGSVCNAFHIELPASATVGELRSALGGRLANGAEVFDACSTALRALKDDASLPARVTVERLECAISMNMVLTANQCKEAHEMLMETLRSPKMQKKLDELEVQANKNETKYSGLLAQMLEKEVYPKVVSNFGLPEGLQGISILMQSIGKQIDYGSVQRWVELAKLMRDTASRERAEKSLASMDALFQASSDDPFLGA